MKLGREFYTGSDVVFIARNLLGKVLVSSMGGAYSSGMITETEAYAGITDKASHAFNGRRSGRTRVMYGFGGLAYVYLCYGVHSLFNVVTNQAEIPDAVLVRAIKPLNGQEIMNNRLGMISSLPRMIAGPGKLTRALGIHYSCSGIDLTNSNELWIEDRGLALDEYILRITPRIGIDYAAEDALLPYRFVLSTINSPTA